MKEWIEFARHGVTLACLAGTAIRYLAFGVPATSNAGWNAWLALLAVLSAVHTIPFGVKHASVDPAIDTPARAIVPRVPIGIAAARNEAGRAQNMDEGSAESDAQSSSGIRPLAHRESEAD